MIEASRLKYGRSAARTCTAWVIWLEIYNDTRWGWIDGIPYGADYTYRIDKLLTYPTALKEDLYSHLLGLLMRI